MAINVNHHDQHYKKKSITRENKAEQFNYLEIKFKTTTQQHSTLLDDIEASLKEKSNQRFQNNKLSEAGRIG